MGTTCPICTEVFRDPVLVSCCGQSFCRECLDRAVAFQDACPFCRVPLLEGVDRVLPNRALRSILEEASLAAAAWADKAEGRGAARPGDSNTSPASLCIHVGPHPAAPGGGGGLAQEAHCEAGGATPGAESCPESARSEASVRAAHGEKAPSVPGFSSGPVSEASGGRQESCSLTITPEGDSTQQGRFDPSGAAHESASAVPPGCSDPRPCSSTRATGEAARQHPQAEGYGSTRDETMRDGAPLMVHIAAAAGMDSRGTAGAGAPTVPGTGLGTHLDLSSFFGSRVLQRPSASAGSAHSWAQRAVPEGALPQTQHRARGSNAGMGASGSLLGRAAPLPGLGLRLRSCAFRMVLLLGGQGGRAALESIRRSWHWLLRNEPRLRCLVYIVLSFTLMVYLRVQEETFAMQQSRLAQEAP